MAAVTWPLPHARHRSPQPASGCPRGAYCLAVNSISQLGQVSRLQQGYLKMGRGKGQRAGHAVSHMAYVGRGEGACQWDIKTINGWHTPCTKWMLPVVASGVTRKNAWGWLEQKCRREKCACSWLALSLAWATYISPEGSKHALWEARGIVAIASGQDWESTGADGWGRWADRYQPSTAPLKKGAKRWEGGRGEHCEKERNGKSTAERHAVNEMVGGGNGLRSQVKEGETQGAASTGKGGVARSKRDEQGGRVAALKTLGLFGVSPGAVLLVLVLAGVEVACGECVWEGGWGAWIGASLVQGGPETRDTEGEGTTQQSISSKQRQQID
jgi:hypothetical protein